MSLIPDVSARKFRAEPPHVGQTEFVYEHSFIMKEIADVDNIVSGYIKANMMSDPAGPLGTKNFLAVNEWANFYDTYRVLYCNIDMVVKASAVMMRQYMNQPNDATLTTYATWHTPESTVNTVAGAPMAADQSNETMWLVCFPSESTTLLTDYDDIIHHPRSRKYLIPSLASGKAKRVHFSLGLKRYYSSMPADRRVSVETGTGVAFGTLNPFEDWHDFTDTNPDFPLYLHLYVLNTDNSYATSAHLAVQGQLKITYGVLCANKDELSV